jgi:hypothetical protein
MVGMVVGGVVYSKVRFCMCVCARECVCMRICVCVHIHDTQLTNNIIPSIHSI